MSRERGSITVMTVGFLAFLALLVVVVVNASAAFLQRQQLDNVADGAALSAADGLSEDVFYREGRVELDDSEARRLVRRYVTSSDIRIVLVTTDDDQVRVRLEQPSRPALSPPGWTTSTTIVSEATAQLLPAAGP